MTSPPSTPTGAKRILLVAAKTGYQVREFASAAQQLGVELVLATDRCHVLADPWGDRAAPVDFANPTAGIQALAERGPFDGILAVGDEPAWVAAKAAEALGLRYHSPQAAQAAKDKFQTRKIFRAAGLLVPGFEAISLDAEPDRIARTLRFPCVLKPLDLSASRGVIRANNRREFARAFDRIAAIVTRAHAAREGGSTILVEDFIPGPEFAVEGVVTGGRLIPLALFDKPDPLDGPFFEEFIYVTPSRQPISVRQAIHAAAQRAVEALGLSDGPVHAEMRANRAGVWMLEVAARPIGGLCSRVLLLHLKDRTMGLEELLLRHAMGEDVSGARMAPGEHAAMMIPIPQAGVYQGVTGVDQALSVPGITGVEITAKEGQALQPLPEGASYLGFIFARASEAGTAETALRQAHRNLSFLMSAALPVVR